MGWPSDRGEFVTGADEEHVEGQSGGHEPPSSFACAVVLESGGSP